MKYKNACDIFPEKLLRQIQKYVSGELVYIPAGDSKKAWGETSGYLKYLSDRNNEIRERYHAGASMELFHRICGPEENMRYRIDEAWFEKQVVKLQRVIQETPDMPPLIVHYVEHDFELNDGNHRLEAYSRLGIKEHAVIVWITEEEEYKEFQERFGSYMEDAPVVRK